MKDFLIILPAFYFCSHPVERLLVGPFKRNFFRTGRCPVERIWEDRKKRNKQTKAIKQLQIKPPALRSIEFLLLSLLPRISHPTSPPPSHPPQSYSCLSLARYCFRKYVHLPRWSEKDCWFELLYLLKK